ncbi:hypothetical protein [Thiofilum flexile]|uniref:hypothetical protein n=1 Tax=Thiofilum flexile TaxID=125627 RepID=UPI000366E2F6|nr:hypothetical protein [Thiofilum flexile]
MSVQAPSSWEIARQRATLYCQFHCLNEYDQQQLLDKACLKLAATYGTSLDERELIQLLIHEVQVQLSHLSPLAASQHPSAVQPGYRRAKTGPVLNRSSIRAAVLERF